MRDIYQAVTERIVRSLEQGVVPWVKPWHAVNVGGSLPRNAVTGRAYSGINIVLLWAEAADRGFVQDRWLTFKQAREAGGSVRKGERATLACLYKPMTRPRLGADGQPELDDEGRPKEERFAILRGFNLFNVEQCEGLPESIAQLTVSAPQDAGFDPLLEAEALILASGARVEHMPGNEACYAPVPDRIRMPARQQFGDAGSYYATLLHELTHWTGHPSRLRREIFLDWSGFGSPEYAYEELIAEMGAAFLCGHLGIPGQLQHESYIGNWLRVLKNDNRLIFKASGAAREATEHLLQLQASEVNDTSLYAMKHQPHQWLAA